MENKLSNDGVSHHIKAQIDLGLKRVFEEFARDDMTDELKKLIEQLKDRQTFGSGTSE